jgi:hypothetical protein
VKEWDSMSQTRTMTDVVVVGPAYPTSWALTTESRLSYPAPDDQYGHRLVCEVRPSPWRKPTRSGQALRVRRAFSVVRLRQRSGRGCQRNDETAFGGAGHEGTDWRGDLDLGVGMRDCREGDESQDGLTASLRGRRQVCAWRGKREGRGRER